MDNIEDFVRAKLADGELADFTGETGLGGDDNRPVVQAAYLRDLLLTAQQIGRMSLTGLRIKGARVEGRLDLTDVQAANLPGIELHDCEIPDGVFLSRCRVDRLSLEGSRFSQLRCFGTRFGGDVVLSKAVCKDGILLDDAAVDGSIYCFGTTLAARDFSLSLISTRVGGSVVFGEGFHSDGLVSLDRARIQDRVVCRGAHFDAQRGELALSISRAAIGGDLILSEDTVINGEVTLSGTEIGGNLLCDRLALSEIGDFTDLQVKGTGRFQAASFARQVRFERARFGNTASFENATFADNTGFSRTQFGADAKFDNATFASFVSFDDAVFEADAVFIGASLASDVSMYGARIQHSAVFRKCKIQGTLNLAGAEIRRSLQAAESTIGRVDLSGAKLLGFSNEMQQMIITDALVLRGAIFQGTLNFSDSTVGRIDGASELLLELGVKVYEFQPFAAIVAAQEEALRKARLLLFGQRKQGLLVQSERFFRTLKLAMENIRARGEEQKFYRLELIAKRSQARTPLTEKVFSALYGRELRGIYWAPIRGACCGDPIVCDCISGLGNRLE